MAINFLFNKSSANQNIRSVLTIVFLSLLACFFILQITIHYPLNTTNEIQQPHQTIIFQTVSLDNNIWVHGALTNGGLCSTNGCQLTLAITNKLSETRKNISSYWAYFHIRLLKDGKLMHSYNLSSHDNDLSKYSVNLGDSPEFFNLADYSATTAAGILLPNEFVICELFFFKSTPTLYLIRENPGPFLIVHSPGKYRLQVIYNSNRSEELIFDYPDFTVE